MRSCINSLVLIILASFLFEGCDKNNDPDPDPLPCLLTSSVTTGGGNTFAYSFVYDNKKLISSTTTIQYTNNSPNSATSTYSYNSVGDLAEIASSSGYREVFTYSNGEVTKKEKFNNSNKLIDQTDYEYANGRLVKTQQYYDSGSPSLAKEAFTTYEYGTPSDKNPVRTKYYYSPSDTNPATISEFTYTDQKSAYAAAPDAIIKYFKLGGQIVDNTISKIVVNQSGTVSTVTYTYEFNTNGFPTKRIETYSVGPIVNTTIYTYDCN